MRFSGQWFIVKLTTCGTKYKVDRKLSGLPFFLEYQLKLHCISNFEYTRDMCKVMLKSKVRRADANFTKPILAN